MGKVTLIINTGSTSRKYAFFDGNKELAKIKFELSGIAIVIQSNQREEYLLSKKESTEPLAFFVKKIGIAVENVTTIGIRVVAPGSYFQKNRTFDKEYETKLIKAMEISPLHIAPIIEAYNEVKKKYPQASIMAISDSAFHETITDFKQQYGIKTEDAKKYDIKRFGYHGISNQSIIRQLKQLKINKTDKIIICHLGGGTSITAVKNFKSIETTMGFTPLSGITMSTRPGDLDPALVIYLWNKKKWNRDKALSYFSTECGLKGMTGEVFDIRNIIKRMNKNDSSATSAFDKYIHDIKKTVGAYMASLNGVDLLVFTGGIGENSHEVRAAVCKQMECFGIKIDSKLNKRETEEANFINSNLSSVKVAVIPTMEEAEMRHQMYELLDRNNKK